MTSTPSLRVDLPPDSTILLAVSGGGDSVCLAHQIARIASAKSLKHHICHVNHGRRGDEDSADAAFVGELAASLSAGFAALRLPEPVVGDHSLEDRLRKARYAALRAEALRIDASAIAFGHTADDVAETFLLMALRGSGPTGLGSLRESRWVESDRLWHVRPLLNWTRAGARAWLREEGISWREDPTNEEPIHRRNRLRADVLPLLTAEEPAAISLLARSATLCAEASDLLEDLAREDLATASALEQPGLLVLNTDALRSLSPVRLAILLRVAWRRVASDGFPLPPPRALVESLCGRVRGAATTASHFLDHEAVQVRVDRRHTILTSPPMSGEQALEILMQAHANVLLLPRPDAVLTVTNSSQRASRLTSRLIMPGDQGSLAISVVERSGLPQGWAPVVDSTQREASFDPLSIKRDLVLRAAREGETISMGSVGSKLVADALQEAGIAPELRPRVAVLADDRGILWIPGIRRAVSAYVTERSTLVLCLQWLPSPSPETSP